MQEMIFLLTKIERFIDFDGVTDGSRPDLV